MIAVFQLLLTTIAILAISITTWFYSSEIAPEFVTMDLDDFQILHLKTYKFSYSQTLVVTSNSSRPERQDGHSSSE